jgi:tRNA G18 (ribose-2'-O)-methylase SpoU
METLERLENPTSLNGPRQRRLLYHEPRAPSSERRHDVQYEPSVDHPTPRQAPIPQLVVVLDDLRSQWNVGSIFRTVDGAGWGGIHLCGITPMPPSRGLLRVSLGAEEYVPWDYRAQVLETLAGRAGAGFTPVALEQTDDACDLYAFDPPRRMALVVGNEVAGVSREALQTCPARVCIPLFGRKASLNAAVAFGVAALELRRRWLALHG